MVTIDHNVIQSQQSTHVHMKLFQTNEIHILIGKKYCQQILMDIHAYNTSVDVCVLNLHNKSVRQQ